MSNKTMKKKYDTHNSYADVDDDFVHSQSSDFSAKRYVSLSKQPAMRALRRMMKDEEKERKTRQEKKKTISKKYE